MVMSIIKEHNINDTYLLSKFGSFSVIINKFYGFFNADKLCKENGKHLFEYVRHNEFAIVMKAFANTLTLKTARFHTTNSSVPEENPEDGSYFHPVIFLSLASWCSYELYIKACIIINDFFTRNADRRKLFARNFNVNEKDTYLSIERVNDSIREISYGEFKLQLTERGMFNATKFCSEMNIKIENFISLKSSVEFCKYVKDKYKIDIIEYSKTSFPINSPIQDICFHPILFLRMAAWVNFELYIKIAQIVILTLNQCDEELQLFALDKNENGPTTETQKVGELSTSTNILEDTEKEYDDSLVITTMETPSSIDKIIIPTVTSLSLQAIETEEKNRSDTLEAQIGVSRKRNGDSVVDASSSASFIDENHFRILKNENKYLRIELSERVQFCEKILSRTKKLEKTLTLRESEMKALREEVSTIRMVVEEKEEQNCTNEEIALREKEKYRKMIEHIKNELVKYIAPNIVLTHEGPEFLEIYPLRCFHNAVFIYMTVSLAGRERLFSSIRDEFGTFFASRFESLPHALPILERKPGNRFCVFKDIIEKLATVMLSEKERDLVQAYAKDDDQTELPSYTIDKIATTDTDLFPLARNLDLFSVVKRSFEKILKVIEIDPYAYLSYSDHSDNSEYIFVFIFYVTRLRAVNFRAVMTNFICKLPKSLAEIPPNSVFDTKSPMCYLNEEICSVNSVNLYNIIKRKICSRSIDMFKRNVDQESMNENDFDTGIGNTETNEGNNSGKMGGVILVDENNRKYVYICSGDVLAICLNVSTFHGESLNELDQNSKYDITMSDILELRKVRMRIKNLDEVFDESVILSDREFWSTFQDPNILTMRLLKTISLQENVALRLVRSIDETLIVNE